MLSEKSRTHFFYTAYGDLLDNNQGLQDSSNFTGPHNHYTLTGRELDAESGLVYFGARYLKAGSRQWMTRDPLQGFRFDDPRSFQAYLLNFGNVMRFVDMDGARPLCLISHEGGGGDSVCGFANQSTPSSGPSEQTSDPLGAAPAIRNRCDATCQALINETGQPVIIVPRDGLFSFVTFCSRNDGQFFCNELVSVRKWLDFGEEGDPFAVDNDIFEFSLVEDRLVAVLDQSPGLSGLVPSVDLRGLDDAILDVFGIAGGVFNVGAGVALAGTICVASAGVACGVAIVVGVALLVDGGYNAIESSYNLFQAPEDELDMQKEFIKNIAIHYFGVPPACAESIGELGSLLLTLGASAATLKIDPKKVIESRNLAVLVRAGQLSDGASALDIASNTRENPPRCPSPF